MADDFILGRHPVNEAVLSERTINKLWILQNSRPLSKEALQKAKQDNITLQHVPKQKLDQLAAGENHQGVIASVAAFTYAELDDLFSKAEEKSEVPFFLMLDGLEDPHNFGSILRTADASGAHGVIIPKRRSAGLTPAVAKTSTGALEHVPVCRVTNLARTMDELKKRGIWFAGTAMDGSEDFRRADLTMPLCLVIGNEGKGVSRLVRDKCDFLLNIPMTGHVESLNASVAAALLMYEVMRKRGPGVQ